MKKTILVATDFSRAALNAAIYAADMASVINADLYLLHIYQLPVGYGDVLFTISVSDMEQIAERDMNEFKTQLLHKRGDTTNITTEVKMGSLFPQLTEVCMIIKPYTVVMGSQGKTAAEQFLFGSHAVYTMKHLEWPLITVPTEATFSSVKKVALACDFNKVVDTIPVDEIKLLVKDFKAELHIVNTGKEKVFNADIVFESGLLQEMFAGLDTHYHFVENENTDEGIIEYAEKNSIDLLITFPKKHSLIDKLLHKSHTRQLVLHSHVPVMALHQ